MTDITQEAPLVSVVIATRNRAEMLKVGMHSVLSQTWKDFELLVVDDGSTDETKEVVESFRDPRVRYLRQVQQGISAARNLGADESRGAWTAVHDDDDIMVPTRLAQQLDFVNDSVDFVYGSFINFDDETGQLQLHHGRNYGYGPALMSGFAPGHSTWLVRTELLRQFRYDEGIESAVDNNLTFRMLRSGVRFRHSGVMCLLRRVHSGRITDRGGAGQKYVARMNLDYIRQGISADLIAEASRAAARDWGPLDKTNWQTKFLPFLPDHLVRRSGYLAKVIERPDSRIAQDSRIHRVEAVDAAELDWFDFMSQCSEGAPTDNVQARMVEPIAVERILATVDVTAELKRTPPEALALAVAFGAFENASRDSVLDTDFAIVQAGYSEAWSMEAFSTSQVVYTSMADAGEYLVGIVPMSSFEAARIFTNRGPSSPGLEFRLLTKRAQEALEADVHRVYANIVPQ